MADKDKSKQFMDELQKAVEQGRLPRDILDFAQNTLIVGGDVTASPITIGHHNVVNYYPPATTLAAKEVERDEQSIVAESLTAYRSELISQLNKASENPYPGLLAYRLPDASHFFGRKLIVSELMTELERKRIIWLHGGSGTGKSSLIQAGLMPALLEKGALPILVRPFDEYPTMALKKTLLKRRWSGDLELAAESLLQFLARLDETLPGGQICVFFDQFEEFVDRQSEIKQVEFARELADCVADLGLSVHFVFSLRSDKFGETAILRERLQPGLTCEYHVRPLRLEDARQAIVGPLERFGITYQEGLVDAILNHLGTTEVNSPQLQLICGKLFHALPGHDRQITFEHYRQLGEAKGIINDYLRQVLHDQQVIPAGQLKAATYILSTLVTLDGGRDVKRAEDWYEDERLRILTFGWRVEKELSHVPDSALAMQSMHPVTVADFVEQVRRHVSIQGEELRQIVNDMLSGYVRKSQKSFVDDVVCSLRDARLMHEIESDDGGSSYELIHEYLVAEVMGWLDEDEQNARRLRNKLDQVKQDFTRHKLLLDPKELEIIYSQLGNPKLTLRESEKRPLLLSAAAHGVGRQWLAVSGLSGLDWLREACRDENSPENMRQGAAALLGEVNDEEAFNNLFASLSSSNLSARSKWLDLCAYYLNQSTQDHHLSWLTNRAVLFRLAKLRIKSGVGIRSLMRNVASYTAPSCVMIMMAGLIFQNIIDADENLATILVSYLFFTLILCVLGYVLAYLFAETTTSLRLIMRRWAWGWQGVIQASAGCLIGIFLFYVLSGQRGLWFEGGIIALTLVLTNHIPARRMSWYPITMALIGAILISLLSQLLITDATLVEFGAALSTGLFAGVFTYFASQQR